MKIKRKEIDISNPYMSAEALLVKSVENNNVDGIKVALDALSCGTNLSEDYVASIAINYNCVDSLKYLISCNYINVKRLQDCYKLTQQLYKDKEVFEYLYSIRTIDVTK